MPTTPPITLKGDIALCANQRLGLVTHPNGTRDPISRGVHLTDQFIGQPWQSGTPQVICNLFDLLTSAGYSSNGAPVTGARSFRRAQPPAAPETP